MISAPDCVGLELPEARRRLAAAGHTVIVAGIPSSPTSPSRIAMRVICQTESDGGTVCLTVASFLPAHHSIRSRRVPLEQVMDSGCYVLEIVMEKSLPITVGRLGQIFFEAGLYAYVGSAKRHLPHRLARHIRDEKSMRWHIDYLTTVARVQRAYVWPWREGLECELAAALRKTGAVFAGFGSSDCRCGGHFVRIEQEMRQFWANQAIIEAPAQFVDIEG